MNSANPNFKHAYGKHLKERLYSIKKQESYLKDQLWNLGLNSEISVMKETKDA